MRKYFLELFAIGLVDSEGRINTEHMTSDALMTAMKTMEELTQMKMDRLVLETTMEMILCMFESCDTEEFTEILRLVFRPDTKAVQRWMVLPICRGSDIHGENV